MNKSTLWSCDFETTTNPDDCRVWAWAAVNIEALNEPLYGNSIESFMLWLSNLKQGKVWFHNAKFDCEFIMWWLLTNGFEHVSDKVELAPDTFTTLIAGTGQFYSMTIQFSNGTVIEIRDSLKVIPLKVEKIPKAFGLKSDAKLDLDYKADRPIGHELTQHEKEYIREDVMIVAKALSIMFAEGQTKLTAAANSLAAYKKSIGGQKRFDKLFPECDYDNEIRRGYRGGFCYVNPKFKGRNLGAGLVYDVNSLYPSVMASTDGQLLPYGDPKYFIGKPNPSVDYPLWIVLVDIDCSIKKDHIPCIQVKEGMYADRFCSTDFVEDTKGIISRVITSVDFELIEKQYNINYIEYHYGYAFHGSRTLVKAFIEENMAIKAQARREGNEGRAQIAKLKMNSLYGKFGTNPTVTSKIPVISENDTLTYEEDDPEERGGIYLPFAMFVTSWARLKTICAAQANYDRFIYADTDSIHLLGIEPAKDIEVDDVEIGKWALETIFDSCKYLRPKTYIDVVGERLHIHVAGLPERCFNYDSQFPEEAKQAPKDCETHVNIDNFTIGAKYWGKLTPKHVKGGVVLVDSFFTVRE